MKLEVIALVVTLVLVGSVMAVEESTTASVTVNEFIDTTIGGVVPIAFGSVNPGASNNPAGGAVTVTIESTTNIDTDTYLRGDNWVAPAALAISNVKYGNGVLPNATMSTAYGGADTGYFENVPCPCGGSAVVKSLYFWLSVPAGQKAGAYTATNIYVKTVKDGTT